MVRLLYELIWRSSISNIDPDLQFRCYHQSEIKFYGLKTRPGKGIRLEIKV